MNKEKKRIETRKYKAIRRTVIFLIWLLLASACHLYGVFPMQAVRDTAENCNIGRTSVVHRILPPRELKAGARLFYLTANKNAVLLSAVEYNPLGGWMDGTGAPLDCSKEAPFCAGIWGAHHSGNEESPSAYYIFGRVDAPDAETVRVSVQYLDDTQNTETYRDAFSLESDRSAWFVRNGRQYFILSMVVKQADWPHNSRLYFRVEALDVAGDSVYTLSDDDMVKTYTSLG